MGGKVTRIRDKQCEVASSLFVEEMECVFTYMGDRGCRNCQLPGESEDCQKSCGVEYTDACDGVLKKLAPGNSGA